MLCLTDRGDQRIRTDHFGTSEIRTSLKADRVLSTGLGLCQLHQMVRHGYEEAMAAPNAKTWSQAMKSEMDSIHKNQTWELVELLAGQKSLSCIWVFRYKYASDSEKSKYKARHIAKGFKQEYGVNYKDIFSPVVKMTTLRLLLGVVATKDLELEQLT